MLALRNSSAVLQTRAHVAAGAIVPGIALRISVVVYPGVLSSEFKQARPVVGPPACFFNKHRGSKCNRTPTNLPIARSVLDSGNYYGSSSPRCGGPSGRRGTKVPLGQPREMRRNRTSLSQAPTQLPVNIPVGQYGQL